MEVSLVVPHSVPTCSLIHEVTSGGVRKDHTTRASLVMRCCCDTQTFELETQCLLFISMTFNMFESPSSLNSPHHRHWFLPRPDQAVGRYGHLLPQGFVDHENVERIDARNENATWSKPRVSDKGRSAWSFRVDDNTEERPTTSRSSTRRADDSACLTFGPT